MPIISHNLTFSFNKFSFSSSNSKFPFPTSKQSLQFPQIFYIKCAKKAKRTGKLRYPSEKKKLRLQKDTQTDVKGNLDGVWRLSRLGVSVHEDPGKDFWTVSEALLKEIAKVLEFPVPSMLPPEAFTVVRKSFDARKKEPKFVYTVDMDVHKLVSLEPRTSEFVSELEPKVGFLEFLHHNNVSGDLMSVIRSHRKIGETASSSEVVHTNHSLGAYKFSATRKPKVVVVGSGPSGLFASLVLAEAGADVTLVERGQAVEQRGRDIGALVVRRMLQLRAIFALGGTWSDGKLVTRIGRNNSSVLTVLKTLVHFGAPCSILVDGKPHLGTDRLIPLLRSFSIPARVGCESHYGLFGTRVDDLLVKGEHVIGVKISDSRGSFESGCQNLEYDAVVLAVGHSARDTYQMLLSHNVDVVQKDFSEKTFTILFLLTGNRSFSSGYKTERKVYHQLEEQNEILKHIENNYLILPSAYSGLASEVQSGRGKVPVADYQVAEYVNWKEMNIPSNVEPISRSCYSFCMCPGGQPISRFHQINALNMGGLSACGYSFVILSSDDASREGMSVKLGIMFRDNYKRHPEVVLTSTDPLELCINGMSFSRRSSRWANAALVVTVSSKDFDALNLNGPLAGVEFQRTLERKAAVMGGGNFVVPVQTVTDFLDNRLSVTSVPPSSYRLGVKAANLHNLFPGDITEALQRAISMFDKELPGFVSSSALLHGVETRTSSPVQITRRSDTWESTSLKGLYPVGEGAGYAGGIVSAAVDGMHAGFAVAQNLGLLYGSIDSVLGKAQNVGFVKY
ncbi:hypothetical protein DH2020_029830 [Rehmannia glutinosa]|uniref:FAD-binding domain-containing protein n=1 Tax=Rehmannia glutinosa TaxID=99300 RepID=A0ABR0VQM9_REHGL